MGAEPTSATKRTFAPPTSGLTTPSASAGAGASGAFGLGSGAFASFGSAKTPKTPGNPFDAAMKTPTAERGDEFKGAALAKPRSMASILEDRPAVPRQEPGAPHALRERWCVWVRPPIPKNPQSQIEYEQTLHPIATVATVEDFLAVYAHLTRPSELPVVTDYHLFKHGIRPIWEDDVNKDGGKWLVRLRKGVADRLWEELLLALIGDQFSDAGEDVCGAVLSMRNGEDTLSIWTRTAGGRVIKIRYVSRLSIMHHANITTTAKPSSTSSTSRTTRASSSNRTTRASSSGP